MADFALAPALVAPADFLDYSQPTAIKLFKAATTPLEDKFDLDPAELLPFLAQVSDHSSMYGWITPATGVFSIPDSIPQAGEPAEDTNNRIWYDLVNDHGQVTWDMILDFADTYVNEQTRLAQNSFMSYHFLNKSLSSSARKRLALREDEYTIRNIPSGAAYLKMIVSTTHTEGNSSARHLREELGTKALTEHLTELSGQIDTFNDHVRSLETSLSALGQSSNDLLTNLFTAYKAAPCANFQKWLERRCEEHDDGTVDYNSASLMMLAEKKFRELKRDKLWMAPSPEQEQIIALQAQVVKLQKQSGNTRKSGNSQRNPQTRSQSRTSNNTRQGSSSNRGQSSNASGQSRRTKPAWMSVRGEGNPNTKTVEGKTYYWCARHKSWVRHNPSECRLRNQSAASPRTSAPAAETPQMCMTAALAALQEENEDSDE